MSEQLHADLDTHYIQGYARAAVEAGKDGAFRVPLVSHIKGNLYVGGCINGATLPHDFVRVFSMYMWEQYVLGPDTALVEVEMYDSDEVPDPEGVHYLAKLVVESCKEGKTLVHCQAGLNRSNLVAATALIQQGSTPEDAIALLRERRSPVVLCNEAFEEWLLTQGEDK